MTISSHDCNISTNSSLTPDLSLSVYRNKRTTCQSCVLFISMPVRPSCLRGREWKMTFFISFYGWSLCSIGRGCSSLRKARQGWREVERWTLIGHLEKENKMFRDFLDGKLSVRREKEIFFVPNSKSHTWGYFNSYLLPFPCILI